MSDECLGEEEETLCDECPWWQMVVAELQNGKEPDTTA